MAPRPKKEACDVLDLKYLTSAGKNEFVKRLKEVHDALKEMNQDERLKSLDKMAKFLVTPQICNHKDKARIKMQCPGRD